MGGTAPQNRAGRITQYVCYTLSLSFSLSLIARGRIIVTTGSLFYRHLEFIYILAVLLLLDAGARAIALAYLQITDQTDTQL